MFIKTIISDMDGIVVNSEIEHFLSYQRMLKLDYGIDYSHEDDKEFMGTTDKHVFTMLKKRFPQIKESIPELIERRTKFFFEIFKNKAKALPCVYSLFDYFKKENLSMALGTSASRKVMEFTLETLHLKPYFQAMVCADDVQQGKPAPDIFLKAAQRLKIEPKYCLVLEDSQYGVQAAKTAGMKCIAIPCGPTLKHDHSQADHIVKSLCDITPELLQSLI